MLINHKEQSPNSITIHKLTTAAVQLPNCLESVLGCRTSQLKRKRTSNWALRSSHTSYKTGHATSSPITRYVRTSHECAVDYLNAYKNFGYKIPQQIYYKQELYPGRSIKSYNLHCK